MQAELATTTAATPRLVVAGVFGPQRIAIDVDPTFSNDDDWLALMATAVDAMPERYDEELIEYIMGDEEEWIRRGC